MEKHHVGDAGFSQAQKNDAKLGRTTQRGGDIETSSCFAADSEPGNICWPIAGLSSANEVFGCK
jgi:hypothetical protein